MKLCEIANIKNNLYIIFFAIIIHICNNNKMTICEFHKEKKIFNVTVAQVKHNFIIYGKNSTSPIFGIKD